MSATASHLFVPLLVAAGVATVGWLALLVGWIVKTRPGHISPGPAAMLDLEHEPLPPAVVNLLANHWQVENEAMAATLVDLAARRIVAIEEIAPQQFLCRVKEGSPGGLLPFEQRVLQRVKDRASGGTAPLAALDSRPAEADWSGRFFQEVVADARSRGLSRPRLSAGARALLRLTALVPAGLAYAALTAAPVNQQSSSTAHRSNGVELAVFAGVTVVILFVVPQLSRFSRIFRAERPTPGATETAARWLGFREYLIRDENFPRLPPSAVVVWGRNLSYGIALGAAAAAARALPFGQQSDHEAWSPWTGQWRIVRVRYPRALMWGSPPWRAVVRAVFLFAGVALIIYGLEAARRHSAQMAVHGVSPHGVSEGVAIASVVVFAAVVPLMVSYGGVVLWFGLVDAFSRSEVNGLVVRCRSYRVQKANRGSVRYRRYVAVDDGSKTRIRAYLVDAPTYHRVNEGVKVHLQVTPHLGHVSDLTVVEGRVRPFPEALATSSAADPALVPAVPPAIPLPDTPDAGPRGPDGVGSGDQGP